MFRKIKISLLYTSVILLSLSITNIFATNTQQEIELKTNINLQTQVYKLDTKYRNIVFDLGGVLASFNIKKTIASLQATGKNIPQKVIEKLASIPHLPEHLEYNRGVLSKELYYKKIAEKLFPDKKNHHFVAEIHDAADDDLKIDPHALVLLSTLKAHGYKTYLLSNLVPAAEQHILKQDPSFFAQFDGAIFSYKIKAIKPEPAIYNALFKTYNLIPDECLFIDDMEINIQGGKALGMDGIVFSSIDQVLIDLIHLGVLPTSGKEFQGQIERARNMNEQNKKIICHDIHNNKKEVDSDQLIFRPSVYGILIENNQVLLSKQWDGYDFPGGGIEFHETIEQALKREFIEETGIEIELIKPIFCTTSFFNPSHSKKYNNQYWNCQLIYFLVKKIGGNFENYNLDQEEIHYADKPEWVNLDQIGNIKFYNAIDSVKLLKAAIPENTI